MGPLHGISFRIFIAFSCSTLTSVYLLRSSYRKLPAEALWAMTGEELAKYDGGKKGIQPTNEKQSTARIVSCPSHSNTACPVRMWATECVCVCVCFENAKNKHSMATPFLVHFNCFVHSVRSVLKRNDDDVVVAVVVQPTMAWINMCGWWK